MAGALAVRRIAGAAVERSEAQRAGHAHGGHPCPENFDHVVVYEIVAVLGEHEIWRRSDSEWQPKAKRLD